MYKVIEGNGIYSPIVKGYHIGDYMENNDIEEDNELLYDKERFLKKDVDMVYKQVAVIGDIHGTTKFIDGYMDILKNNNQVEKIIVLGDHFDPYDDIPFDVMVERYEEFLSCMKKDKRIISILGNHDLATYVISDCTNRTERSGEKIEKIGELIRKNLKNSYLVYRIGKYLFSHAGVSNSWMRIAKSTLNYGLWEVLKQGWSEKELDQLVRYYDGDFSGYGDNVNQGPTWIRPNALMKDPYEEYNQVIGHTRFTDSFDEGGDFPKIEMKNGGNLWMTDNGGNPQYLRLLLEI